MGGWHPRFSLYMTTYCGAQETAALQCWAWSKTSLFKLQEKSSSRGISIRRSGYMSQRGSTLDDMRTRQLFVFKNAEIPSLPCHRRISPLSRIIVICVKKGTTNQFWIFQKLPLYTNTIQHSTKHIVSITVTPSIVSFVLIPNTRPSKRCSWSRKYWSWFNKNGKIAQQNDRQSRPRHRIEKSDCCMMDKDWPNNTRLNDFKVVTS